MEKITLNLFNGNELSITEDNKTVILSIGNDSCQLSPSAVKELVDILSEYVQLRLNEGLASKEPNNEKP